LEGGFIPGFSSNNYQAETDEYYEDNEQPNLFNERSDPRPEQASPEFRPHQKVYRTKPLEEVEASNFGERIAKRKNN
jgi:hypothetical protein